MQFKVCYLEAQGCKNVSSSKNDGFRYEMIGEPQPEHRIIRGSNICPHLFDKSREFNPIYNQNFNSSTQHRWIVCAVLKFSQKFPANNHTFVRKHHSTFV